MNLAAVMAVRIIHSGSWKETPRLRGSRGFLLDRTRDHLLLSTRASSLPRSPRVLGTRQFNLSRVSHLAFYYTLEYTCGIESASSATVKKPFFYLYSFSIIARTKIHIHSASRWRFRRFVIPSAPRFSLRVLHALTFFLSCVFNS